MVESWGVVVKACQKIFLKHDDDYSLPEGEEDGDFDGEELEESRVRSQRFMECMIEKDEIVEGVRGRNGDDPADTARNEKISGVL